MTGSECYSRTHLSYHSYTDLPNWALLTTFQNPEGSTLHAGKEECSLASPESTPLSPRRTRRDQVLLQNSSQWTWRLDSSNLNPYGRKVYPNAKLYKRLAFVTYCCCRRNYTNLAAYNNTHLLSHGFGGSGIWAHLNRVFYFRVSQEAAIKVSTRARVLYEGSKLTWLLAGFRTWTEGLSPLLQFLVMWASP